MAVPRIETFDTRPGSARTANALAGGVKGAGDAISRTLVHKGEEDARKAEKASDLEIKKNSPGYKRDELEFSELNKKITSKKAAKENYFERVAQDIVEYQSQFAKPGGSPAQSKEFSRSGGFDEEGAHQEVRKKAVIEQLRKNHSVQMDGMTIEQINAAITNYGHRMKAAREYKKNVDPNYSIAPIGDLLMLIDDPEGKKFQAELSRQDSKNLDKEFTKAIDEYKQANPDKEMLFEEVSQYMLETREIDVLKDPERRKLAKDIFRSKNDIAKNEKKSEASTLAQTREDRIRKQNADKVTAQKEKALDDRIVVVDDDLSKLELQLSENTSGEKLSGTLIYEPTLKSDAKTIAIEKLYLKKQRERELLSTTLLTKGEASVLANKLADSGYQLSKEEAENLSYEENAALEMVQEKYPGQSFFISTNLTEPVKIETTTQDVKKSQEQGREDAVPTEGLDDAESSRIATEKKLGVTVDEQKANLFKRLSEIKDPLELVEFIDPDTGKEYSGPFKETLLRYREDLKNKTR